MERLSLLAVKLIAQHNKIPETIPQINYQLKKIFDDSDENSIEESESENDLTNSESNNNIETPSYLYTKQPIKDFFPGSFELLLRKAQMILSENKNVIFKPGITYQAQIEIVIKLIHSPNCNRKAIWNIQRSNTHSFEEKY